MAGVVALSKLLHVRESEKKDAQRAYQQSIEFFEGIATQLYSLLRKKEVAEESFDDYLQRTTPIDKITEQFSYIEFLNRQILQLQHEVQKARNEMEMRHEGLTNAHVEVKKFEKVIEHRHRDNEEIMKKYEKDSMDEISMQQYMSRKIR